MFLLSLLFVTPLAFGSVKTSVDVTLAHLSRDKYFPYQDIVINGNTIWNGLGTDCPSRYAAISAALKAKYNRPISVLDIGANNGYFSLKLAKEHGAHVVMADMSDRLTDICELNTDVKGQVTYVKQQLSAADLARLSKTRKFDAVIALHVLHHVPDWKDFIGQMFNIAETVIIETPPANDPRLVVAAKTTIPAIEETLIGMHGSVIAETPRVKPGAHGELTVMKSGVQHTVETVPGVKSKMFMFHSFKAKPAPGSVSVAKEQLKGLNVVYPK